MSQFRVGDWQVEPQQNLLEQGERQVRLEPKVMDVLCTLAAHAGEVLTKERLLQAVWPDTYVCDESLTNLRAVPDPTAENGWKIKLDKFPGWKDVPTW